MTTEKCSDKIICESSVLESGGLGHSFFVEIDDQQLPAFVVRFQGEVYAYLNQCAHLFLELDWENGEFFDLSGDYIMCANHGALFEPASGECVSGPCYGASLRRVPVTEVDNAIMLDNEHFNLVKQ